MALIYVCQDGPHPSGVATYGYSLLLQYPAARMLLLNADRLPLAAPEQAMSRIELLPESQSHNPRSVAEAIDALAACGEQDLTILPNTGDTPWAAVGEWLRSLDVARRSAVRVLGIVHSDVGTQYQLAAQYSSIAPVWIGVSRRCSQVLRERVAGLGVDVRELPYPIVIPPEIDRSEEHEPISLAYVGRLDESQKKVSRLVLLAQELDRRNVGFRITIAGDGPERERLEKAFFAQNENFAHRVRFTGAIGREAIDEIWRVHRVVLLVSSYEGFPLVLLEAMAAGVCPVVMKVDSGIDELIDDGVEGHVLPQGDVVAMADRICSLASDPGILKRMSSAARKRVTESFSGGRHFASLSAAIHDLWQLPPPNVALLPEDFTMALVERLVSMAVDFNMPVAIYGAGMFGRKVVDACLAHRLEIRGWFDSDASKAGTAYRGLVCSPPGMVVGIGKSVIIAASREFPTEISARIEAEFNAVALTCPPIIRS